MSSKFKKHRSVRSGGDDELVEKYFGEAGDRSGPGNPAADRKVRQLCREVARVVAQIIPGELNDPILESVSVMDVYPAPDASRLAIRLHVMEGSDLHAMQERLDRLKGHLRAEIAAAIQRKRTPELVFDLAPEIDPMESDWTEVIE